MTVDCRADSRSVDCPLQFALTRIPFWNLTMQTLGRCLCAGRLRLCSSILVHPADHRLPLAHLLPPNLVVTRPQPSASVCGLEPAQLHVTHLFSVPDDPRLSHCHPKTCHLHLSDFTVRAQVREPVVLSGRCEDLTMMLRDVYLSRSDMSLSKHRYTPGRCIDVRAGPRQILT